MSFPQSDKTFGSSIVWALAIGDETALQVDILMLLGIFHFATNARILLAWLASVLQTRPCPLAAVGANGVRASRCFPAPRQLGKGAVRGVVAHGPVRPPPTVSPIVEAQYLV